MSLSSMTHLNALKDDALDAIAAAEPGPPDINQHTAIVDALTDAEGALPPLYEHAIRQPLLGTFTSLGPLGWMDVRASDPHNESVALLGLDLTQSVVQRADGDDEALRALQEVVSDLYDGFLSDADREGVKPPDYSVIPPLVKWGRPDFGPYAWTAPATRGYGCGAGVVNFPPAFANFGLAAWSTLGHETAGHHILHADKGLRDDLARKVANRINASEDKSLGDKASKAALAWYWASRIDEAASDVMGVLNMGPASAIGLIAYFRALRQEADLGAKLSNLDHAGSVRPNDIARGYLTAWAVDHCSFAEAKAWRTLLVEEVDKDVPAEGVWLGETRYPLEAVRDSAKLAAKAIMKDATDALDKHSISEVQNWRDEDQLIVQNLILNAFLAGKPVPEPLYASVYAAHAVAAAIMASLVYGQPQQFQRRMIDIAAAMHRRNPAWTGLDFAHSGALPHPHPVHVDPQGLHRGGAAGASAAERHSAMHLAFAEVDDDDDGPPSHGSGINLPFPASAESAAPSHGSSIRIPPLSFAARAVLPPPSHGSGIVLPPPWRLERVGLSAADGQWSIAADGAEVAPHPEITPKMLGLILSQPT